MTTLAFSKGGKACSVSLHGSCLQVQYAKRQNKLITVDIPYVYILAAEVSLDNSSISRNHSSSSNNNSNASITLHYIRHVVNRRLRVSTLTVSADLDICNYLVTAVRQELDTLPRPQSLVVIINPNSGKKQAEKVFTKKVLPLFNLCGITCHVVVTKAAKQARDMLQTMSLDGVDGLVTVGGDGLYCEVVNGLVLRTQLDHGVPVDDPEARLRPATLPVGLVPAGTGDVTVQYLHGTRDVLTAALRVVLGATRPANTVSVHQGGRLSAYAGLLLAFGLQGDMMADCERYRWMGASRYNVIPISTVLSRRSYDVEVEYDDEATQERKRVRDVMYSVDTYVVEKDTRGPSVQHVFGEDTLRVHMTSKCALGKHVQQLTKLKEHDSSVFDYDFIRTARVQGFTVRLHNVPTKVSPDGERLLASDKYNISVDGDVLKVTHPEFMVRLHHHALRLFGESVAA